MKQLRRTCAGLILVLALSLTALGGIIHNPPPTGPQESPGVAGDMSGPGVDGQTQTPGIAGDMQTPGITGEINIPGLLAALFSFF